jgi:hypothetical protein
MAESRPVSKRPRPPMSRTAVRRAGSFGAPFDSETDSTRVEGPRAVPPPPRNEHRRAPADEKIAAMHLEASSPRRRTAERSRAEKILFLVLLLGFGMNLGAFLMEGSGLTRVDLLFAGATLFSGLALLALTEVCRRTGGSSR